MENKPTHLIIPIKDREHFEEDIRIGDTEYLSNLLFTGKQVALDEDSVEMRAKKLYDNGRDYPPYPKQIEGYKRAIKDLLL